MTATRGTGPLLRLLARTTWVTLATWLAVVGVYVVATSLALDGIYSTPASRAAYATTAALPTPERIFNGPGHGLGTRGGIFVYEAGGYLLVAVAIMAIWLV